MLIEVKRVQSHLKANKETWKRVWEETCMYKEMSARPSSTLVCEAIAHRGKGGDD